MIIPDGINVGSAGSYYNYFYMMGVYNKFTKVFTYYHRNSGFTRNPSWADLQTTQDTAMTVDFQGKAGSYRQNMSLNVVATNVLTGQNNYLVISSAWSFFEQGLSAYTASTNSLTNPQFYTD